MKDNRLDKISNSPWTVNWTDEDAERLRKFIYSETGRKLEYILRSESFGSSSADYINGVENTIQKMKQIPFAPIVKYRAPPQTDDDEEGQEIDDPDTLAITKGDE